ncbi:hypothetical protein EDD90_8545 [Streptomyces sp. Ag109_O5-1]|uniref:hypothetical protein n=1 Tax=Streptomyces TaxID=1883 RepID=UPI000F914D8C|nr:MULTISPECIES: hypothetical protein [Streptomyces]RPE45280.1 hypothetical protein EDD90_8545 [Streptomyces sp. Ag109_O5-1]
MAIFSNLMPALHRDHDHGSSGHGDDRFGDRHGDRHGHDHDDFDGDRHGHDHGDRHGHNGY